MKHVYNRRMGGNLFWELDGYTLYRLGRVDGSFFTIMAEKRGVDLHCTVL